MDTTNLIKFVLIGHVDHGKSTCAGRILVETGKVDQRTIDAAIQEANTNKMATWWLSYLVDDDTEKSKGKTNDYIIIDIEHQGYQIQMIDVPGHRSYIHNMIDGACQANVAVLICSAKPGEYESGIKGQTLEHLTLVRGMGVNQLIVAINKMDHENVKWSAEKYNSVVEKVTKIAHKLCFKTVRFVPISALTGENITVLNKKLQTEKTLMDLIVNTVIETKTVSTDENDLFEAKCLFLGKKNLITTGYQCCLHSGQQQIDCVLTKLDIPFIRPNNRNWIKVNIKTSSPIVIEKYIILRDGNDTIGMGAVI